MQDPASPLVNNRLLPLQGGRNFRDLGGYRVAGGRQVRWKCLYRSGVLTYLTDADRAYLSTLGVRVVCDFRTPSERAQASIRWDAGQTAQLNWDYDTQRFSLGGLLQGDQLCPQSMRRAMIGFYEFLPTHFAVPYRAIFTRLAAGHLPLVISCSAGKDRTGLAAALVLTALGVSWKDVLHDYCLTNQLIDLERAFFTHPGAGVGFDDTQGSFAKLTPEVRAPLLEASPAYLEAAFVSIERTYGSFTAYLETVLGITGAQRELIRDHLLESTGPSRPERPPVG
jgi:protein-tyrosine phosphatase